MTRSVEDHPLLVLFLVAAVGYPLGRVQIAGVRLGVAAVLFAGLAFGAFDPGVKVPEIVMQLGLVLFVYSIGLSNGSTFVHSWGRTGFRNNAMALGVLVIAGLFTTGWRMATGMHLAGAAGMYAGALTNTPALAAILETLRGVGHESLLAEAVLGYTMAYPIGVLGTIGVLILAQKLWKADFQAAGPDTATAGLTNCTVEITNDAVTRRPVSELVRTHGWQVVFGRLSHHGELSLVGDSTTFALGDRVTLIATTDELDGITHLLGVKSDERLDLDRRELDYRRIFVSNPKVAGQSLMRLNLPQVLGAIVTRVRRGDVELLARRDTVLELGDRVRVLARRDRLDAVSTFFGDSYRAVSEIDVLTFSLGIVVGLVIGLVPIPFFGLTLRLGLAGGPLIAGLVLGALYRTGPLHWTLPYSANMTLRQVGLVLFLAGVGTRNGFMFVETLKQGDGLTLLLGGALTTTLVAFMATWIGYRYFKLPFATVAGMVSAIHTQPAVLGFALEQSKNDLPNVGYASVYPTATLVKIILAQAMLALAI